LEQLSQAFRVLLFAFQSIDVSDEPVDQDLGSAGHVRQQSRKPISPRIRLVKRLAGLALDTLNGSQEARRSAVLSENLHKPSGYVPGSCRR
jgi:hypothetical protein